MNTPDPSWTLTLLRAVGFALLHSLWQGAVLGLVLAGLLRGLRGQAALVRYRLAAWALATLVGLSAVTFGKYCGVFSWAGAGSQLLKASPGSFVGLAGPTIIVATVGAWPEWLESTIRFLEQHLAAVVLLWLLGFGVMATRLLLSWAYVRQLRRAKLSAVPAAWQQHLAELARRASLHRSVELAVSALVPSPVVIGYFKPLILLPLGLLGELSPAAMEMLLAHELAHIIRRDYVLNILQAVAEAAFFYHPAVWYISAVLHAERENCCDDLATQLGGNPQALARALAALAELTLAAPPVPRLCLAANGAPGSVLHRVQRLARPRPVATTGGWPAGIALLSTVCLLCWLVVSGSHTPPWWATNAIARATATRTIHSQPDDAPRTGRRALAATDNALHATFQARLLADGLVADTSRYALLLTANALLIDGRRQPGTVLARYHRLYEAATGYRITATTSYRTEREVLLYNRSFPTGFYAAAPTRFAPVASYR